MEFSTKLNTRSSGWGRDWGYFEGQLRKSTAELRAGFWRFFGGFSKLGMALLQLFCLPHGFRVPGGTMETPVPGQSVAFNRVHEVAFIDCQLSSTVQSVESHTINFARFFTALLASFARNSFRTPS